MSKAEILKAIRSCAKKLNRKPTRDDLRRRTKINWDMIRKHFGGMKEAMELAGLEATGSGFPQTEATLLKDWAMVARKLEKLPSVNDYRSTGRFSDGPFFRWDETAGLSGTSYDAVRNALEVQRRPANEEE
jgi:hypothetical protein